MSGTLPTYSKTRRYKKTNFFSQFTRNFPETGPIFVIFTSLYIQQDETSGLKFVWNILLPRQLLAQLSYKFTKKPSQKLVQIVNFSSLRLVKRTRRVSLSGVFVKTNHTGTETNPLPFIEDDDRRVLFCMVTQLHPIPVSSTDKGKLFFIFSTYTKT